MAQDESTAGLFVKWRGNPAFGAVLTVPYNESEAPVIELV
jgi:hypothetical protein